MVCGTSGFKTLARHIAKAHQLKPAQYRKQFNIPSSQSLTAKNYSDARRASAIELNLGAGLVTARATRKANAEERIKNLPAKRVKAPVPSVIKKAGLPSVIKKAAVPAKIEVVKAPVKADVAKATPAPATKQKVSASAKAKAAKKK
jgi:predicted transcriptional regulator